ncbi:MAG TPA: enoyl-CoA hydratase [Ottowia sp.]|mgnify:CR=1 FL=1|uniref:enoyl-CoA hydratase n=1 Tax=Ottowia sp. TaxID=1898956 RepID=UPI002B9E8CAC|nr:enoyl-CoA hydratase [Ottowia sp.]HMN21712.1 enoyl-CoA hydratase [Ottowia sp.]
MSGSRHSASPDAKAQLVLVGQLLPGCALVTLNRPHAANALTPPMRRALAQVFDALDADAGVIVLTGAGSAFCAGLDLKELSGLADPAAVVVSQDADDPVAAMRRCRRPIIGAVNGAAVTGGLELALACDILIASTSARFADTHARVGVLPSWGLSQLLPRRIGGGRAKEMALTGNFVSATQAEGWGLVNRVVPPEQLLPQALALAADMLSIDDDMLSAYKRLIDDGAGVTLEQGLRMEAERARAWAGSLQRAGLARSSVEVRERGRRQVGHGNGRG